MSRKILIALSGGMDSTSLLSKCVNEKMNVEVITFIYGSKHNQYEIEAARHICRWYEIPHDMIDLSAAFEHGKSDLLKSGGEIPEGHYEDESMSRTVVPGRNLIFLTVLAGVAESRGIELIGTAVHSGDHFIYPDCRPDFILAAQSAIIESTEGRVKSIYTPFIDSDKTGILKEGYKLATPYHLTRTCYKDQEISCGQCGSCRERLEAFENIGKWDPIDYVDRYQTGGGND